MAWYNKYRPTNFEDVIGQDLVKTVLQNAIAKDKVKHAYLLSGSKGIGKTTLARIFANELNSVEQNPEARIDIVELDAASNTGIDDVRMLIESAKTPPLVGPRKIYIIDEVHMLSKPAMNALLKILEEPPSYLVFLLATTNPEKLIPTVLSRLTKLNLSTHSEQDVLTKLTQVSQSEGMRIDLEALQMIAKRSAGSQRDAINLLETLSSYGLDSYGAKQTAELLGLLPEELLLNLAGELNRVAVGEQAALSPEIIAQLRQLSLDGDTLLAQLLDFLLERSLNGRTEMDALILPLAQTLDLRLPLTDPIGAAALLQVSLRGVTATQSVSPKPPLPNPLTPASPNTAIKPDPQSAPSQTTEPPSPETPSINKNVAEKEPGISQVITPAKDHLDNQANPPEKELTVAVFKPEEMVESKPEPEQVSDPAPEPAYADYTPEPVQETSQTHPEGWPTQAQFADLFRQIAADPATPPFLKMILPDLQVLEVTPAALFVGFSNGLFLGQFQNDKIQNLLKQKIKQAFGMEMDLEGKIVSTPPPAVQQSKPAATPSLADKLNAPGQKPPARDEAPNPKSEHKPGDYFYSVYRELPPEIQHLPMPVFEPPLAEPAKTGEDWEDHANELFDFE